PVGEREVFRGRIDRIRSRQLKRARPRDRALPFSSIAGLVGSGFVHRGFRVGGGIVDRFAGGVERGVGFGGGIVDRFTGGVEVGFGVGHRRIDGVTGGVFGALRAGGERKGGTG